MIEHQDDMPSQSPPPESWTPREVDERLEDVDYFAAGIAGILMLALVIVLAVRACEAERPYVMPDVESRIEALSR